MRDGVWLLIVFTMATSGCIGSAPFDAGDDSGDATEDHPTMAAAPDSGPVEAMPRWSNTTGVDDLADCRILRNLVSAGIPEHQLPYHVSVPLGAGDAAGNYSVYLAGPADELAEEICIAFTHDDLSLGFSTHTNGTIPMAADRLIVAGEVLANVTVAVHVAPPGYAPAAVPEGEWRSGPWIAPEDDDERSVLS